MVLVDKFKLLNLENIKKKIRKCDNIIDKYDKNSIKIIIDLI